MCLGFGGFCILGRYPSLMRDFLETLALVIPFISKEGVRSVHLYGSIFFPALAALLSICDHHDISMSVDSAFPSFAPRIGKWGYGSWRRNAYRKPPVLPSCKDGSCPPGTRCLAWSACGIYRKLVSGLQIFALVNMTRIKFTYAISNNMLTVRFFPWILKCVRRCGMGLSSWQNALTRPDGSVITGNDIVAPGDNNNQMVGTIATILGLSCSRPSCS